MSNMRSILNAFRPWILVLTVLACSLLVVVPAGTSAVSQEAGTVASGSLIGAAYAGPFGANPDSLVTGTKPLGQIQGSSTKKYSTSQFITRGSALTGSHSYATFVMDRFDLLRTRHHHKSRGSIRSAPRAPPSLI